ncbi:glycerate kinase type-2 family protein [Silvibacterium acidisoli]|uniref:glycerate kinase type-2 family protein n=1 Tax=Acidobacteriaceae bacterium ZG23-2 TaxID=2883246 RepID=UPI00406D4E17
MTTALDQLHADANAIFSQALAACDIAPAFDRHIRFDGKTMLRQASPVLKPVVTPLDEYKRVLIISFGLAGLSMMEALLERLPKKISVRGVCSAPELPKKRNWRIKYFEGGHPLPNEDSFKAAAEALRLLKKARENTFVFFLLSGGGSAMLELPRDEKISLDDTIAFHETLVSSGATVTEINTVRKYFSAVKGGRLALAAPQSQKLTLLLADVPLKDLGAVASSPTLPDQSSPQQCAEILERFHLLEKFPQSVREYFDALNLPSKVDTTQDACAQEAFAKSQFETLLSNHDFVNAARDHAQKLGYRVIIDQAPGVNGYQATAISLLTRFHELRQEHPKLCLLSSGELKPDMPEEHGCSGGNQQFALASAFELANYPEATLAVFSASSDGVDGNSPAAGAVADPTTIARARAYGFDPETVLTRFDACPMFTALGDVLVTGSTGKEFGDLRLLLAQQ